MLPAQITLALLGGFLAIWAATLILRALARRFEQASIRRLKAANLPLPAYASPHTFLGPLAALTIGFPILLAGLFIILLAATLEAWLLRRPIMESLGGIFIVAASILILLALASTLAGWFFDPSRGRARCPRCWYDLQPALTPTASKSTTFTPILCSECGHTTPRARDLYRTRRKANLLWIAVLALACSYLTYKLPAIRKGGITAAIPSTVLIAGLSWLPDSLIVGFKGAKDSLDLRDYENQLWDWQERWLQHRADHLLDSARDIATLFRAATFKSRGGTPLGLEHFGTLIDGLVSKDPSTVQAASYMLGNRFDFYPPLFAVDQTAISRLPQIAALLDHPDPDIAGWALWLISLVGPAADDHLDAITRTIERLPKSRSTSYRFLARLAAHSDTMLNQLIHYIQTGTDDERIQATRAARLLAGRRSELAPILLPLADHPSADLSHAAIIAVLRAIDPDDAAALIVRHLKDYRGSDRQWLIDELFAQGDRGARHAPEMVTAIRAVVADVLESTDERISAATKLALFGRDPQSHALIASLKTTLTLEQYQLEPLEQALQATMPR